MRDETGLVVPEEALTFFGSYYVRNEGHDLMYHMFSTELPALPEIMINPPEHQDFAWVTPEEALKLDYIHDLDECIWVFYGVGQHDEYHHRFTRWGKGD